MIILERFLVGAKGHTIKEAFISLFKVRVVLKPCYANLAVEICESLSDAKEVVRESKKGESKDSCIHKWNLKLVVKRH